jgi:hypothetical protein
VPPGQGAPPSQGPYPVSPGASGPYPVPAQPAQPGAATTTQGPYPIGPYPVPQPEGAAETPPAHPVGAKPWAFAVHLGPVIGGLGAFPSDARRANVGLHARTNLLFPLLRRGPLAAPRLHFDLFTTFNYYRASESATDPTTNTTFNYSGHAILVGGGIGLRGNFPLSQRVPIVIAPGIGAGVGAQVLKIDGSVSCVFSAAVASPILNFDLLTARYELSPSHSIYLALANLYVILPALNDGVPITCNTAQGLITAPVKYIFALGDTRVNYALDFGYGFHF